ncbi:hypothetical protein M569_06662, partial [Genlisea aurea]
NNGFKNEKKKKMKKEKKSLQNDGIVELVGSKNKKHDNGTTTVNATAENRRKIHKSKKKKRHLDSEGAAENGAKQKKKKKLKDRQQAKIDDNPNAKRHKKKKVRFSSEVEIFHIPVDDSDKEVVGTDDEDKLIRGKRFTKEEDDMIKEAVSNYVEHHDLGEKGLEMVLNSRQHPTLRGCWKEIGSALPHRPYSAVYYRAQILLRRKDKKKWSQEEYEMVLNYQKEHGNQWKALADELGRHRIHVKDTWRQIKLENMRKGHWSQQEYQKLFDLVNVDLQNKVSEEKRSKHGMLRDNICWTAISDVLSTRTLSSCCIKWYNQLTSPLVKEGLWADTDDYRLLLALHELDSTCSEDVDWDNLVEERSGEICRRRWNQMVLHIGNHGNKSFSEQVEVLAKRYCPSLLQARMEWDSKPLI